MRPDRRFLEGVLADLAATLDFLEELRALDSKAYLRDKRAMYSSAYALLMAIEGAAAVASHLIATQGWPAPQGVPHSFWVLFEQGVVTSP